MRPLHLALALAGVLACSAAPALAGTIKVPQHHATIQAAVDAAQPGDKVVVGPGIYLEQVLVDGKSDLTIVGRNGHQIGDAAVPLDVGVTIVDSQSITLRKLRFVPGEDDVVAAALIDPDAVIRVEDCHAVTVRSCRIVGGSGHGVDVVGSTGITVFRNVIEDVGASAIAIGQTGADVDDAVVLKNKIAGAGDAAIAVSGSDALIERNKIQGGGGEGIRVTGSAHDILSNRIDGVGSAGIRLYGDTHLVQKNRIEDSAFDGVDVEADSCLVLRNKVWRAGDDGLSLDDTTGSLIERNKVYDANGDGVRLASTGNTLNKNLAKDSGDLDLRSLVGADENTFSGNTFPENNIGL